MESVTFVRRSSLRQSLLRLASSRALVLVALAAFGCGKPFNVKTRPDIAPADYATKATTDHISVQAKAITDEDFLYETFDANLLLAGILPVRVMLTNSGGENANLKDAHFEVQTTGSSFKALNERQAFKRLISYYEITTYNKSGYKESLETFSAYGLDTRTPLPPGQSRQGLLFFSMPSEAARGGGLTLVVTRLEPASSRSGGRLELKLN